MKDAWLQLHELLGTYTKEWEVRPDLEICAPATERGVEIRIGELRKDYRGEMDIRGKYAWHSTGPRNVNTIRELITVLTAACDFVDDANPEWASHRVVIRPPETFEMNVEQDND